MKNPNYIKTRRPVLASAIDFLREAEQFADLGCVLLATRAAARAEQVPAPRAALRYSQSYRIFEYSLQAANRIVEKKLKLYREALEDAEAALDAYADVRDGDYGQPAPNEAMRVRDSIQNALSYKLTTNHGGNQK